MELNMKESGKMIYNTDMELKCGWMDLSMMEPTVTVRNTAEGNIFGLMGLNMMDSGRAI
jgi:hypothetical protein